MTTLVIFLGVVASLAAGQASKLSPDLQGVDPSSSVNVIVRFKSAPNDVDHQRMAGRGAALSAKLNLVKGGAYTMPASALAELTADERVTYVSLDRPVSGKMDLTAAAINERRLEFLVEWNWDRGRCD